MNERATDGGRAAPVGGREAAANLLEVENLHVAFRLHGQGVVPAVRGVSLRVRPASTVALVGESGSGKSVIAQAILGILPDTAEISAGSIRFYDPAAGGTATDIATLERNGEAIRRIRGGRISMVFQEPMTSLSPLHTIGDQIGEVVCLHQGVGRREADGLTREMLALVGFPDPERALRTYPFELSGGLRQRAVIAMALVCRPALLIADEPTTALDVTIQAQILDLVARLQARLDMAVLLITHDLGVVANLAEEVVVIYNGELMEAGPLREIFHQPRHPYLKALMRAVPRIGMSRDERLTPIREARAGDPPVPAGARRARDPAEPPLLEVRGLSKRFTIRRTALLGDGEGESVQALDDVSLAVARGECLGLVGESGCGKTTLSKVILRAIDPDAGEVIFRSGGRELDLLALDGRGLNEFRRKAQLVFQDPVSSLNPRMTVFDIISEPLVIHRIGNRAARAERVKELMRQVGLDPRFLSRYPHSFSGGQRQRIGIARALALEPELVICDEPVSALDVSVQAQVLNLLRDLQRELDLTYLFVSHNLAVVDYMADRIAVMCAGRVVEVAGREQIFAHPVHPYTRALLAAVPHADPDRRLDLDALMQGRVSDPAAWPAPFAAPPGTPLGLVEVGAGHWVRALPEIMEGRSWAS